MGKFYLPISCLFFLLYLFGCTPGTHLQSEVLKEGLDDKSAPYELFAFQRSFPDTIFDWKGWNQALSEIKTGNAAQARNGDCDVNSGNWQQQGPYNVGGRCNTLASMPGSDDTVLAGFSSGGIFKTPCNITSLIKTVTPLKIYIYRKIIMTVHFISDFKN